MRLQLRQRQERAADEARVASHANELTRLQLQMQLAQQTAASSGARILQQHQALNVLRDLPLNDEQIKKKRRMEKTLTRMCFDVAHAAPDPLTAIAASLNGMATAIRPAPVQNRAAAGCAANLHEQFDAAARDSDN
jgi:hypothetical protein